MTIRFGSSAVRSIKVASTLIILLSGASAYGDSVSDEVIALTDAMNSAADYIEAETTEAYALASDAEAQVALEEQLYASQQDQETNLEDEECAAAPAEAFDRKKLEEQLYNISIKYDRNFGGATDRKTWRRSPWMVVSLASCAVESVDFKVRREIIAGRFEAIRKRYEDGEIGKAEYLAQLEAWVSDYPFVFANCGELSNFASVIGAQNNLLTYKCTTGTGSHQFAVVQSGSDWYILEAFPAGDQSTTVIGPITMTRDGMPVSDLPGGSNPTVDGNELPSHSGPMQCSLVFDPSKK